jgi:hypothetical protein
VSESSEKPKRFVYETLDDIKIRFLSIFGVSFMVQPGPT